VDTKSGALTEQVLAEIRKLVLSGEDAADHHEHQRRRRSRWRQSEYCRGVGSSAAWTIINTPGRIRAAVKIVSHDNVCRA
jgi:hypothetical protein